MSVTNENDLELVPAKDAGDDFEEIFWGLLRRRYPPQQLIYLPAQIGGDCGIEGYSTDGIAYQCYCDRDSLSLRARTDKQKQKLYRDTQKLRTNATRLEHALGGLVLQSYFLVVPQYHAVELVSHANKRAEVIRHYGLSFIGDDFTIRIKTPQDYPAELNAALADGKAKAMIQAPAVQDKDVELFSESKPQLVDVLDRKLSVLANASLSTNVSRLRVDFIRAFLAKEQIMTALLEWPDTWEAVERRRQMRESRLELESELSTSPNDQRLMALVSDFTSDLVANVAGVNDADAQNLAIGQVGEWLIRCPFRFRVAS